MRKRTSLIHDLGIGGVIFSIFLIVCLTLLIMSDDDGETNVLAMPCISAILVFMTVSILFISIGKKKLNEPLPVIEPREDRFHSRMMDDFLREREEERQADIDNALFVLEDGQTVPMDTILDFMGVSEEKQAEFERLFEILDKKEKVPARFDFTARTVTANGGKLLVTAEKSLTFRSSRPSKSTHTVILGTNNGEFGRKVLEVKAGGKVGADELARLRKVTLESMEGELERWILGGQLRASYDPNTRELLLDEGVMEMDETGGVRYTREYDPARTKPARDRRLDASLYLRPGESVSLAEMARHRKLPRHVLQQIAADSKLGKGVEYNPATGMFTVTSGQLWVYPDGSTEYTSLNPGETMRSLRKKDEARHRELEAGKMICRHCHTPVQPGDSFCPRCGQEI